MARLKVSKGAVRGTPKCFVQTESVYIQSIIRQSKSEHTQDQHIRLSYLRDREKKNLINKDARLQSTKVLSKEGGHGDFRGRVAVSEPLLRSTTRPNTRGLRNISIS